MLCVGNAVAAVCPNLSFIKPMRTRDLERSSGMPSVLLRAVCHPDQQPVVIRRSADRGWQFRSSGTALVGQNREPCQGDECAKGSASTLDEGVWRWRLSR